MHHMGLYSLGCLIRKTITEGVCLNTENKAMGCARVVGYQENSSCVL